MARERVQEVGHLSSDLNPKEGVCLSLSHENKRNKRSTQNQKYYLLPVAN